MAQPTRGRNSQAKNHLITIVLALIIAVLATWFGYGRDHAAADPSATAAPGVTATAMPGDGLTVTYLDVGQGDCTLLQCDGQAMLPLVKYLETNSAVLLQATMSMKSVCRSPPSRPPKSRSTASRNDATGIWDWV